MLKGNHLGKKEIMSNWGDHTKITSFYIFPVILGKGELIYCHLAAINVVDC